METPLRHDAAHFNQLGSDYFPGYIGLVVTEVSQGLLKCHFPVRNLLMAPNGFLHAGSVVTLADTAAGYGCIAHLPEGASGFTTIDLNANFLGTATDGFVMCEARAIHLGRTTQVWDAEVRHQESGRKMAVFRCTQMILWPKPKPN